MSLPEIETKRLLLRIPTPEPAEVAAILRFCLENREHLAHSRPTYPHDYFTCEYWMRQLEQGREEFGADKSARFFVYEKTDREEVIGSVNLSEIHRRSAQFCYLGYGLAASKQGNGYMSEAVKAVVEFAFETMNLHRIMANFMPTNLRSGNLLKRLGFTEDGFAKDYLFLNGKWEDHVLTSITNQKWKLPD